MNMRALIIGQSKLPKLKYRRCPHGDVLSPSATEFDLFITFVLYLRDLCSLK